MAVLAASIVTDASSADQNSFMTHKLNNAMNCVVMVKDSLKNVMMEITMTVMVVQEIVKLNLDTHALVVLLSAAIIVMLADLTMSDLSK